MANNDRVTELYQGNILSEEAKTICRNRIHWMCGKISGQRVLDIGCSQGIASILAAREGHDVVGVDVEANSIEFAKTELLKEEESVSNRLKLVHSDIFDSTIDQVLAPAFHTILLAEILEHQTRPQRLLERATDFLLPTGRIIITTPFGLHVHDDHKFTFYLSSFLAMCGSVTTIQELEIVDGYIRAVVAQKDVSPTWSPSPDKILELSEKAFLVGETKAYEVSTRRAKYHSKTKAEVATLQTRIEKLESEKLLLKGKLDSQRAQIKELTSSRDALLKKLQEGARLNQKENQHQLKRTSTSPSKFKTGPLERGRDVIASTIKLELSSGRVFKRPDQTVIKTYARFRRALRQKNNSQDRAKPHLKQSTGAPSFEPWTPHIAQKESQLTVACIFDTFSEHCFRYEANLISLSRNNWLSEMQESQPDFLFCESAWRGNNGQWKYLMTKYAQKRDNPLRNLLKWCRTNNVPTVFWNKEDPANFEVFIDVAKDFEFIFTTDEDCVERYKKMVGHDRVFALPFAAQPAIHNPIQDGITRDGEVCFAGSWRADKYPERVKDSEILLKPALKHGLAIYDRFFGTLDAEKFAFPKPFDKAVVGSLDYDRMLSAYRGYKTFLNVNSIKSSPTMFSRRVFELMACGTPVVSTESLGITKMLGSLVKVADSEQDVEKYLEQLLGDDTYRGRFAHAGYREILREHTYQRRLEFIADKLELEIEKQDAPLVTIIAATNRPERLDNLLDNVRRQVHSNIELIIILNSDAFDTVEVEAKAADIPSTSVFQLPEAYTLADCLNFGIDRAAGDWLAKLDDDDFYGPHYLSDYLLATNFTDASIIGKHSYFCYVSNSDQMAIRFPHRSHQHIPFVHGGTLFVRKEVFDQVRFTPVRQGTDTIFLKECVEKGFAVYSSDPYNFVHVRAQNLAEHTWKISDEDILKKCRYIREGLDLGEVMI